MTIVHLVLFKFRPEVPNEHRQLFQSKLKELRSLPCVKESRLIVGGQSITDPPERSKGFQHALLSFHEDEAALKEYQASKAHHEVTAKLMFPFKEDLIRYDFEVAPDDEHLLGFKSMAQQSESV
ncbi:hypothetical protein KC318_g5011 [Hortaea werneckii]|nr:hypothetical protein KC334_g5217 [Hortaea werneckii]KAI7013273.1 hypothetical protein KC355_g5104 [Hortaea werneckii]KAI7334413.1 hypothetical protein KC315_g3766 [Hortaea werneckii]KAI7354718.1 hypothetical protein KC354_g11061 [Hortaea werneckii]KAI7668876.1 hypothetical protein KC318_g5011 [Hortaea werneckii]